MSSEFNPKEFPVGIIGLGMMGSSIAVCMLIAGHPVTGVELVEGELEGAKTRIKNHFKLAEEKKLLNGPPEKYLKNLHISSDLSTLKDSRLVIESIKEDIKLKKDVFEKVDKIVANDAYITSNTSAIPISQLQVFVSNPERFYGLHWMEPAFTTRFLEVICGDKSDQKKAQFLYDLGELWQKEAVLLKKDIPGFIANRLMYAMYREAMHLVDEDYASVEDVDRACRNVAGYFIPMMGVFRWMDFTGIASYHKVMKDLFPTLSNADAPGNLMNEIVEGGGKGIFNGKGFYEYTEEEKEIWQKLYNDFSFEIRDLALKYPADIVQQKLKEQKKEEK